MPKKRDSASVGRSLSFLRRSHLELAASSTARVGGAARAGGRGARGSELAHLHALVEGVEDLHVVGVELKVEELSVGLNAALGERLGENDVADLQAPTKEDLGRRLAVLVGNGLDLLTLQSGTLGHGRVGLNMDTTGNGGLAQLLVGKEGVRLDLVDGRLDAAFGQEVVELLDVEL